MLVVLCLRAVFQCWTGVFHRTSIDRWPWKHSSDVDVLVTSGASDCQFGDQRFPGFIIQFHKSRVLVLDGLPSRGAAEAWGGWEHWREKTPGDILTTACFKSGFLTVEWLGTVSHGTLDSSHTCYTEAHAGLFALFPRFYSDLCPDPCGNSVPARICLATSLARNSSFFPQIARSRVSLSSSGPRWSLARPWLIPWPRTQASWHPPVGMRSRYWNVRPLGLPSVAPAPPSHSRSHRVAWKTCHGSCGSGRKKRWCNEGGPWAADWSSDTGHLGFFFFGWRLFPSYITLVRKKNPKCWPLF